MADNNYFEILEAGGAVRIEDDALFDFATDLEIRWDLQATDWFNETGTGEQYIFSRYDAGGTDRVINIVIRDTGATSPHFRVGLGDGSGGFRSNQDMDMTGANLVDTQRAQLRLTIDADNGSTETVLTVYERLGANIADLTNNDNWTLVDSNTLAGAQSFKATNDPIWIGSAWNSASTSNFIGRFYRVVGWKDLAQTTKFVDWTPQDAATRTDDVTPDNSEFDDAASSNTWDAQGVEDTDWQYVLLGHGPNSTATVPSSATQGATVNITVQAVDYDDTTVTTGGDTVVINVSGANTATPTVTDVGDGTYTASYTATNTGSDSVAITLNGVAISGSAFTVTVGEAGEAGEAAQTGVGISLGIGI